MNDQTPGNSASPRLAEPEELAGEWRIGREGRPPCVVRFETARIEAANAHALVDPTGCLPSLVDGAVAGWRPTPDGIELAGPDRLTVLLFSYTGREVATATGRGGVPLTLARGERRGSD